MNTKGTLKPISIWLYGLFDKDGKRVFHFTIEDPEKRDKINHLWEQEVDYEEDIVEEVGKKALTHVGPDVAAPAEPEGNDEEAEEDNGEDA